MTQFATMEPYLAWALIGLTLVIVELLTGTFYLLVLGVACFGAALAAFADFGFAVQAIVAVGAASLGVYMVHAYRVRNTAQQMPSVDAGQPVHFESWIDEANRVARVRYRGAQWDANVQEAPTPGAAPAPGATLYIVHANGNTLEVSPKRPG